MLNDKWIKKKIFFSQLDADDLIDYFSSLKIPTLNIIGEKDIIPFDYGLHFAKMINNNLLW